MALAQLTALLPKRSTSWWCYFILAVGALLRIRQYLSDRSLWLDEIMLAENILARDFAGLATPLDHQQMAPLGFLWAVKAGTMLLGPNEWGLRLFPLLCGIAALWLFYQMLKDFKEPWIIIPALLLFCFSFRLTYYSSELKQYISDVCCACGAFALFLYWQPEKGSWPKALLMAVAGAALTWFSHPVIFVLASIGLWQVWRAWEQKSLPALLKAGTAGAGWLAGFGLHFLLLLSADTNSGKMKEYWANHFAPLPPTTAEEAFWYIRAAEELFFSTMGIGQMNALLLFILVAGIVAALVRKELKLIAFAAPIGLMLLASGLGQYPFANRLLLFLTPSLAILLTYGAYNLFAYTTNTWLRPLLLALLLFQPLLLSAFFVVKPIQEEETKLALAHYIGQRAPADRLHVYHRAERAFRFYKERYGLAAEPVSIGAPNLEGDAEIFEAEAQYLASQPGTVWVLFAHEVGKEREILLEACQKRGGAVSSQYFVKGAGLVAVTFQPTTK